MRRERQREGNKRKLEKKESEQKVGAIDGTNHLSARLPRATDGVLGNLGHRTNLLGTEHFRC